MPPKKIRRTQPIKEKMAIMNTERPTLITMVFLTPVSVFCKSAKFVTKLVGLVSREAAVLVCEITGRFVSPKML